MKRLHSLLPLLILLFVAQTVHASKPVLERSAEACERILNGAPVYQLGPSPSTLIPMSLVLKSADSEFLAQAWRWAVPGSKQFPTAGLAQMYRTAETAADGLVEAMAIKNMVVVNKARNPYDAAVETLKLIRSSEPPEYIRNAVFIRDNIVVVVPILKRLVKKSSDTGLPVYTPIITKGHQSLQDNDILSAAFSAWALSYWQHKLPNEAYVYLQPMARHRRRGAKSSPKAEAAINGQYRIDVRQYMPQLRALIERFMRAAELAAKADQTTVDTTAPARRTKVVDNSPWSELGRARLTATQDISMMPNPPADGPTQVLRKLKRGTLDRLAELDPTSEEFIDVAVNAGITPERLRYFITHALATTEGEILVVQKFEDPTLGFDELVHIDFEDMLSRRLHSGVYLFGAEIQNRTGTHAVEKKFIFAEKLDQPSIELAWVEFFGFLKNHPRLKDSKYLITTYSKHEVVKIEQEFDVLKQPSEKFTKAERDSDYYSEFAIGDKIIGRLIRRKDFFKKHPSVHPTDVFTVIDRMVDLLDFVRADFAFPGHTNSIKHVLKHLGKDLYGPGRNGLESIAWAKEAYATGEASLFKKIQDYNEVDIDGNRFVSDFIREHAGRAPDARLKLSKRQSRPDLDAAIDNAVRLKRHVGSLTLKRQLLERILGRDITKLTRAQLGTLMKLLNRSDYLEQRQETASDELLNEDEVDAHQQRNKFDYEEGRSKLLYEFLGTINPKAVADESSRDSRALADLMSQSSNFLLPSHIEQILLIDALRQRMMSLSWTLPASAEARLELPTTLEAEMANFDPVARKLWWGLYLIEAFPVN